ncbi:MAG: cytochrome b561 [Gammaproteobacteria bacterium]|jgi:cytochrome b561
MSLKNTTENYGVIAKSLHWLTAFLFLVSYCSVYYRHWFTEEKTSENWIALQLHLSIGISLAVVIILRLIWRNMNRLPEAEPGTRLEHLAAHFGHYVLYAVMIIMPLTGYIGTGVNTEYFFLFDIPKFENTVVFQTFVVDWMGLSFKAFEKPIDFIHKDIMGSLVVWLLIVGHISAALYHHYIKHDRTIKKMTTAG